MSPASIHIRREENEFVKFWIHRDILYIGYKPNTRINLPAAKKISAQRLRFQNGKSYPVICFINGVRDFDKHACNYSATIGLLKVKAISYVGCRSLPVWLLCFYIRYYKPHIPTKLSSTREEALAFLAPYLKGPWR